MNECTPVLFSHCCDAKIIIKRKNDFKIFIISKKNYVEKNIDIILASLARLRVPNGTIESQRSLRTLAAGAMS